VINTTSLDEIDLNISLCSGCSLAGDRVIGRGSQNAKIMFIGEAPGKTEIEQGKPFVGPAGKLLMRNIEKINLSEDDYYVTNCCKCRPKNNRTPTDKEIETCKFFLEQQIEAIQPKIIVLLGNTPIKACLNKTGITKLSGKPIEKDGIIWFPLLHPAASLHQPKYLSKFESDFLSLGKLLIEKGISEKTQSRVHDDAKQEKMTGLTGKVWEEGKSADVVYAITADAKREVPEHDWAHLHAHTEHSVLDAVGRIQAVVNQYVRLGFKSCTITDHGTMSGCYSFYKAAKKAELKPIIGVEAYICNDHKIRDKNDTERRHITLLAKSLKGYYNLLKLTTISHRDGFYYKPRIDYKLLEEHKEGIICCTACINSVLRLGEQSAALHGINVKEDNLRILKAMFGEDLYVEIMPHDWDDQKKFNKEVYDIATKNDVKVIITNDSHYILKTDREAHNVVTSQTGHSYTVVDLHLTTKEEMIEKMKVANPDIPYEPLFENVKEVTDKVEDYTIPIGKNVIPEPLLPVEYQRKNGAEDYFDDMVEYGFTERAMASIASQATDKYEQQRLLDIYKDRLKLEIEQIKTLGFMKYFLIVHEYLSWCTEVGIDFQARGSVGGSLVAYCMKITNVDPIINNLIFERFISPNRSDLPDIDIDVEDNRREDVINHLREIYGDECVAHMEIWVKMTGRLCLRDVARYCGVPNDEVGAITITLVQRSGGDARVDLTISDSFEQFDICKKFDKKYPKVLPLAMRLESGLRGKGTHAAGVFVSPTPLYEYLPLERAGKTREDGDARDTNDAVQIVSAYDPHQGEELGLLKLDLLGVNTLSVIHMAEEMIGKRMDWDEINWDDEETFKEFSEGHTVGVFQMESPGLTKMAKSMGVESFDHVVALNALHRPGPLHGGIAAEYIKIKQGITRVRPRHPIYDRICKNTYGLVIYQEQVLHLLRQMGQMDWGKVNVARKILKHSTGVEAFGKQKIMFVEGCQAQGIGPEIAEGLFNDIITFGSYGFNMAHACLYGTVSFRCMYLKTHYPKEYMAALLQVSSKSDRVYKYVNECRRLDIEVLAPDINRAGEGFTVQPEGMMIGLSKVDRLGEKLANEIIKNRPYNSIRDLLIKNPRVNHMILKNLAAAGSFDNMYPSRKAVHDEAEWITTLLRKNKVADSQSQLSGWMDIEDDIGSKLCNMFEEWDYKTMCVNQEKVLGLPSGTNMIEHYSEFIDSLPEWIKNNMHKIDDLDFEKEYPVVYLAGSVKPWQMNLKIVGMEGGALSSSSVKDEGKKYWHANCEDDTDFVLLHISTRMYEKQKEFWDGKYTKNEEFPILVKGAINPYISLGRKAPKIYVEKFLDIDDFMKKRDSNEITDLNEFESDLMYDDISSIRKYNSERSKYNGILISQIKEAQPETTSIVGRVVGVEEFAKIAQITIIDESGYEQVLTVFLRDRLMEHLRNLPMRSVVLARIRRNIWRGRVGYILEDYERLGD